MTDGGKDREIQIKSEAETNRYREGKRMKERQSER